ncbi:site-specific integrase [Azotobacter armeniacus]
MNRQEAEAIFSPRDLRRTCAQLMQRHGVSNDLSDLLQAHGQTGVVGKHYRNNPEAALPEKRRAIELFDKALAMVLREAGGQAENMVLLSERSSEINSYIIRGH